MTFGIILLVFLVIVNIAMLTVAAYWKGRLDGLRRK